jgi:hypothetical protein
MWRKAVMRGEDNTRIFGLCHYVKRVKWGAIRNELQELFGKEFGDKSCHPFDEDEDAYRIDCNKHLNKRRVDWVNKMIAAYEATR